MTNKITAPPGSLFHRPWLLGPAPLILLLVLGGLAAPPPAGAVGTWTALTHTAPGLQMNNMLLLTDGTVLAHDVNNSTAWYKLTPATNGSYINGTWSTMASMTYGREYYSSQVLSNGQVFVAGAEYGSGKTNAEIYDPLANTWSVTPNPPGNNSFVDSVSEILPNGNVLVAPVTPANYGETLIWNTASGTWSVGPTLYRGDDQDEAAWVKLADQSILTIDPFGTNSERYLPASNQWVNDANVPVSMYSNLGELGAGFLLPNGKAFFLGGVAHTAIYTPSGTSSPGSWAAGADIPDIHGIQDGPAAMLVNGNILCCVGTNASSYSGPSYFYEYNYLSNTFTAAPSPTSGTAGASFGSGPFVCSMLDLPDGTVLMSCQNSQLYVYTPDGSPLAAGQPAITSVTGNANGSYHLTGTLFNGLSEGAAYGDDEQMRSDYPIARLTNSAGTVFYARTTNWSSTGVMTGTNVVSTDMTMPAGLAAGTYSLVVVANGIASAPVQISYPIGLNWDANTAASGAQDGNGTWNSSNTNWWNGATDVAWNNTNPYAAIFGNGGTAGTVAVSGSLTNNWLTFNVVGSGAYTLSGSGSLHVSDGIVANASATIAVPLTLAANQAWTVASGSTLTVSGPIDDGSNSYDLTENGPGTLTLSGTNSYGGNTIINSGTLNATVTGALPSTTDVNFNRASAPTLNLQASVQTVDNLIFTNTIPSPAITITGTGGSSLNVTGPGLAFAPFSSGTNLTVDLSGLDSFAYNNSTGSLAVASIKGGSGGAGGGTVTVTLAGLTNTITAGSIGVGNSGGGAGTMPASILNLGQVNSFNTPSLGIGASSSRSQGTLQFATGLTSPTFTIAGGSLTTLTIGSHDSYETNDKPVDLMDTTAGSLNAQLGSITIGQSVPTANSTGRGITITASLKMGAGTLTASTLTVGNINNAANTTNYTIRVTGLLSLTNGGTAGITNLTLANNSLAPSGGTANTLVLNSTVSLTNGATLNATTLQTGSAASPATVTAQVILGGGTLGNLPGAGLNVSGVSVILAGTSANPDFAITAGQVGTIGSVISGSGNLTLSGAGTLKLAAAETYTGSTTVNGGILEVSGSLGTNALTVANTAILEGHGTVNGPATIQSGGQLSPNDGSLGPLTVNNSLTLNTGSLTLLQLSKNGGFATNDQVIVAGPLALGGTLTVTNTGTNAITAGDSFQLFNAGSFSGGFASVTLPGLSGGLSWNTNNLNVNGTISVSNLTYTLTYAAGTNGTLAGTSPQTVNYGMSGTAVTAVPNGGYHFVNWSDGSAANPRTDTDVTGNVTVTANFAVTTCTLTYAAGTNGTLSGTSPQTVNYGGSGTAVTAVANTGYSFAGWSDGASVNPRTDTNVTNNVSVTANFSINTYTLTYTAGTNGSLGGTSPQTVNYGANGTTVTAVPAAGFGFTNWSDGSTADPRTDLAVTNNLTVTANFVATTNGPLVWTGGDATGNWSAAGNWGWALPVNGQALTFQGTQQQNNTNDLLTAVGQVSFNHGGFILAGQPVILQGGLLNVTNSNTWNLTSTLGNAQSFVSSNGILTVSGTVANAGYLLTVDGPGSNWVSGAISGTGGLVKNGAGTLTLSGPDTYTGTTAVNAGILQLSGTLGTNQLTVANGAILEGKGTANGPVTIQSGGQLSPNDGSLGALTINSSLTLNSGSQTLMQLSANGGMLTNDAVVISGGLALGGTLTVTNIGTNALAAGNNFQLFNAGSYAGMPASLNLPGLATGLLWYTNNLAVNGTIAVSNVTYTLTYTAGANGTLSGTSPQTVNYGASGTAITPLPDTGYHFVNWSDGSTANPRTDIDVTNNITVTANFAINTYTLTYTAGTNGTLTGTSPQTVNYGASGTAITPVPNTGYHFVNWSDGSTANPRTDAGVTSNLTVTASFAINTYTLTYAAGTNGTLTGTSPQTVNYGGSGTAVTAVPNSGYGFTNWSDGSIANPRADANVTNNLSVMANFIAIASGPLVWTGNINTNWDIGTTLNWSVSGAATTYTNGAGVQFDDTAVAANVFVAVPVSPAAILVTNNSKSYTIGGSAIGGGASLAKQGSGLLVMTGANTYTGGTLIGSGTVQLGGTAALGGGGITNDSLLVASLSGSATLANVISGPGSLTQNGGGTLTLTATNTYTGGTTISANTLAIGGSGQLGSGTYAGAVADNGTFNYAGSAAQTLAGIISGTGSVSQSGPGPLTLSGVNTYGGSTFVNAGTLLVPATGALPATTAVNFTAATAATLNLQGSAQTVANLIFTNTTVSPVITITGTNGSALSVGPANLVIAPLASGTNLTVNMGGLTAFTYGNASANFNVANAAGLSGGAGGTVTVTLAGGTNNIVAGTLGVGDTGGGGGTTAESVLYLGQNNTCAVGSLNVGWSGSRSEGVLQFATGLTNPVLTVAGNAGAGSLANLDVGEHDSFEFSDHAVDLLDTTAGTLNARLNAIAIGYSVPTANSSGRGYNLQSTFKMGAGTLSASSLTMGNINNAANATNYSIAITALFSLTDGGTASITNITLGNNNLVNPSGSTDHLTNSAVISLTNGASLFATTIQTGNAASAATGTNQIILGGGSLGNLPGGNLSVSNVSVMLTGTSTNPDFTVSAGQTGTVGAIISGSGALTLSGAGTLVLSATNTYTGGTVISSGSVQLNTPGAAGTGAITDNGILSVILGSSATLANVISGSGGIIQAGTGTLTLSGVNTYTGDTTISSGSLTLGGSGQLGGGSYPGAITNNGTFTGNSSAAQTLAGIISGTGTFNQNGPGTLTLSGANTYAGNTFVNGGTLAVGAGGSLAGSPVITLAAGASLNVSAIPGGFLLGASQTLTGYGSVIGNLNAATGAQIIPGATGTAGTLAFSNNVTFNSQSLAFNLSTNPASGNDQLLISGVLTNNGATVISLDYLGGSLGVGTYPLMTYAAHAGSGTFALNTVYRGVTLNVGATALTLTVAAGGNANLTWNGDGTANNWDVQGSANWLNGVNPAEFYQGDTIAFTDTGSDSPAVNLTTNLTPAGVTVSAAENYTFSGPGQLSGAMSLAKGGPGTLFLQTTNPYTGGTTITGGTVELDNPGAAGTGTVSLGTNLLTVNIAAGTLPVPVSGSGTINVTETAGASTVIGGSLSNFTGTLNLPASPGGTAKLAFTSSAVNINSNAVIAVAAGGTFYLAGVTIPAAISVSGPGNSENYGALRLDNSTVSGPVTLQGNATVGAYTGNSGTFSGAIGDGGNGYGLTLTAPGTITLSGANTYTGPTTVTNGTVNVTGNETAATGGWLMPVNYTTVTVNFQAGSKVVVANTNLVQIGSSPAAGTPNNQTLNVAGSVTNYGSLLVARGGYLNINSNGAWVQTGNLTVMPPAGSGYSAAFKLTNGGAFVYNGSAPIVVAPSGGNGGDGTLTVIGATFTTSQGFTNGVPANASTGYGQIILTNGGTLALSAAIPELTSGMNTNSIPTISLGAGGGVINTAGYATAITNLIGGIGGLTKLGTGTLILGASNSFTGATTVGAGTLAVNNPAGSGLGSGGVTVVTNATLAGSGSINEATNGIAILGGTLMVGNAADTNGVSLTIAGTTTNGALNFKNGAILNVRLFGGAGAGNNTNNPLAADLLKAQCVTLLTNAAVLTVGNPGGMTNWAVGDEWKIVSWNSAPVGTFASTNLPALPSGLVWNLSALYTSGIIAIASAPPALVSPVAKILAASQSDGALVINGVIQNGSASLHYLVLTSTNLALPMANWTVLSTNPFNADGTFSTTNTIDPTLPAAFFGTEVAP